MNVSSNILGRTKKEAMTNCHNFTARIDWEKIRELEQYLCDWTHCKEGNGIGPRRERGRPNEDNEWEALGFLRYDVSRYSPSHTLPPTTTDSRACHFSFLDDQSCSLFLKRNRRTVNEIAEAMIDAVPLMKNPFIP